MTVRFTAAACLIMLPLCTGASASPLGVLNAPFASKVLIQQREQGQGRAPATNPEDRAAACRASLDAGKRSARQEGDEDKPARCEISAGNTVAERDASADGALPGSDKKPSSN